LEVRRYDVITGDARTLSVTSQSLSTRMISGVLWLMATKAVGQAITWAITITVVRLLAPQDYGLMAIASLFIGFLLLFNELGLGAAVVQKSDLDTRHLSDLRWAIFAINLALCLFLLLCAPFVATYFVEPALTWIIRVLAVIFVIQGVGVPSACMLQRELRFKLKSQAELVGNVAGSVTTLACAAAGLGVWSLVTGYLLQQVTTNALYCAYYPVRFSGRFSIANVIPFVRYGFELTSARVLSYVSTHADSFVVGRVLGTAQLGYYGLAYQLSSLPTDKITSIVTQVAFPAFSSLQKDDTTLKRYYLKLVSLVAIGTFPMFLGLFLIAESAVPLLLTSKWLPIVLPLKTLCFVSCLRSIWSLNTPLLMAKGRTRLVLWNHVLQAAVLPVGFYVGAGYGLEGVATAWLILWPLLFAIMTWQALGAIGLTLGSYMRALKHASLGSAVMVAIVTVVQQRLLAEVPRAVELAVTCGLGIVLYASYQVLFNRDALSEMITTVRDVAPASPRAAATVNAVPNRQPEIAEPADVAAGASL
jgi:teichuronic acid exporter